MGTGVVSPLHKDDPEWMHGLTDTQRAFFKMLTDQRVSNLVTAADLLGDMDGDTFGLLSQLGSEEYRELRQFMWRCKPETLRFLYEMREQELEELQAAIETYLAFKRTARVLKWGAVTLFGAFVGMSLLWDKLTSMIRLPPPK